MTTETQKAISALDAAQKALDQSLSSATTAWDQPWSPSLIQFLSVIIIGFSFIALVLASILLWRSSAPSYHIIRLFGVISILCFSALLMVVGYSDDQLTPIVGLFGAIAGYLLGRDNKPGKDD